MIEITTAVMIKGNQDGLTLFMNPQVPFDEILIQLYQQMTKHCDFFRQDDSIYVFVKGRKLTSEEIYKLKDFFLESFCIHLFIKNKENDECIHNKVVKEPSYIKLPKDLNTKDSIKVSNHDTPNETKEVSSFFYHGNISSHQMLFRNSSVIILGNVLKNASVISRNNIIVIGSIYGSVTAGYPHQDNSFILALNLQSEHIRIADTYTHKNLSCKETCIIINQREKIKRITMKDNNYFNQVLEELYVSGNRCNFR